MSREINNKLDCCNEKNKEWCKSAIDRIPFLIKEIKEKQQKWDTYYKQEENAYKNAKTNIERAKKQELDMKKYVQSIKKKENKKMKRNKKDMNSTKKTIKNWDKEIEDYVLNDRIEGVKKFKVNATPTIIINDEKFEKTLNYKNLKKSLEKLI